MLEFYGKDAKGTGVPASNKPCDWECSECHFRNFARRERCKECRSGRSMSTSKNERSDSKVTASLVLKGLPSDASLSMITETFQRYGDPKDVRYIQLKRIAFIDFHTQEVCMKALEAFKHNDRNILIGSRFKEPVSVSFAEDSRASKRRSPENADWSAQVSVREQAESILAACPALEPYNNFYTDREREWIFDPETLYWFNYKTESHYLMNVDSQTLAKVDRKTGKLCHDETLPLPKNESSSSIQVSGNKTDSEDKAAPVEQENADDKLLLTPSIPGPVVVASVCYLCQRKFASVEALKKHETLSDLHKANLARHSEEKV